MPSFLILFGADPALDHLHPWETSWLLPPAILGGLRLVISVYVFFCLFFIWDWDATHGAAYAIGQSFSFFTWLNFWGMGFYFLVSAIHSFCYAATGRSVIFDRLPRVCRGLHSLFFACNSTFPFLTVIVYWGILYRAPWFPTWFGAWSNISQHGLIGLYALLEIFLTTTPPHPLIHLTFLILLLALYLALAYLTYHTQGFYTYSFLDPGPHGEHSGVTAGYIFGVGAAVIIIFAVTWFLIWWRRRLTGGKVKRARRDRGLVYESHPGIIEAVRPTEK